MRTSKSTHQIFARILVAAFTVFASGGIARGQFEASDLFRAWDIQEVELSPKGDWVYAIVTSEGKHGVLVQRLGEFAVEPVYSGDAAIEWVRWIGNDTLLLQRTSSRKIGGLIEINLLYYDREIHAERRAVGASGWLVDPLPLDDREVLWEIEQRGIFSVHRVDLDEMRRRYIHDRYERYPKKLSGEVAQIRGITIRWIVDSDKRVRAVTRVNGDRIELVVLDIEEDEWRTVHSFSSDDEKAAIYPVSITSDGERLVVLAYNDHDTRGVYEFDPTDGRIKKEIHRLDGVDISNFLLDPYSRQLRGVVFEVGGDRRIHYFDEFDKKNLASIEDQLSANRAFVASSTADRTRFILWTSGPTEPGIFYFYDANTQEFQSIAQVFKGLDRSALVETDVFTVQSTGNFKVEAFITLPRDIPDNGAPLVIVPHGGPIGVRDSRDFHPLVQYLASWGFAVLQVNYRGSSGYGRQFEAAGKKEWSKGIEDDIDAATDFIVNRPEIDASRLCIIGGSYGGFSALASIIRHRDKFRCAASLNGVTDIPLMFETSDFADYEGIVKLFAENVGDIEEDREALMNASPLYHVEEMETPMLIVYGTRDRRVDPDHSHRLMMILDLLGKEYESIEVEGAAHSFSVAQSRSVYPQLLRFLQKHLMPNIELPLAPNIEAEAQLSP